MHRNIHVIDFISTCKLTLHEFDKCNALMWSTPERC